MPDGATSQHYRSRKYTSYSFQRRYSAHLDSRAGIGMRPAKSFDWPISTMSWGLALGILGVGLLLALAWAVLPSAPPASDSSRSSTAIEVWGTKEASDAAVRP